MQYEAYSLQYGKLKNIHEVILFVVTAFNLHLEMSETDISDFYAYSLVINDW